MQRPKFQTDEYYHLVNRGVNKSNIFTNTSDYMHFLHCLDLFNTTDSVEMRYAKDLRRSNLRKSADQLSLVDFVSYQLMPNHYHIIVRQVSENGIVKFMQKLGTGYTMYFNTRYKSSGHLFQGKFKSGHIASDAQILWTTAYIHLNPIKKTGEYLNEVKISNQQLESLKKIPWSSLADYTNSVEEIPPEIRYIRPKISTSVITPLLSSSSYENYIKEVWGSQSDYSIDPKLLR